MASRQNDASPAFANDDNENVDFASLGESVRRASGTLPIPIAPPTASIGSPSKRSTSPNSSLSRRFNLPTLHSGRSLRSNDTPTAALADEPVVQLPPAARSSRAGPSTSPVGTHHHGSQSTSSFFGRGRNNNNRRNDTTPQTALSNARATLFVSKLARRSMAIKSRGNSVSSSVSGYSPSSLLHSSGLDSLFAPSSHHADDKSSANVTAAAVAAAAAAHQRYKVGDNVLIANQQSRWANLVNRCGFPPGEGMTGAEQSGPYSYVIATVRKVHFEEFDPFYTVVRLDTGADQRADAEFMESLPHTRGEAAALRAAAASWSSQQNHPVQVEPADARFGTLPGDSLGNEAARRHQRPLVLACWESAQHVAYMLLLPFLWIYDTLTWCTQRCLAPLGRRALAASKQQARIFLHGLEPYVCQMRWTYVNFIVLCSVWYMFIDQARLVLFPPSADFGLTIVNFVVWLVLVLELGFEVFIRPDGFRNLIASDRAYAPSTVRYINSFHLLVESASLAFFVPEFFSLFSASYAASDSIPFSFHHAALMAVTGPTRMDAFYGRAYFAVIRLRVFGLVRHWKNMWIGNMFINMRWRNQAGVLSNIVPVGRTDRKPSVDKKADSPEAEKKKDDSLTNASTVGTALMVINSYRALGIFCLIIGIFPLLLPLNSAQINNVTTYLTEQLQLTNEMSDGSSDSYCEFYVNSILAWLVGVTSPHPYGGNIDEPYALNLELAPFRCFNEDYEGQSVTRIICSEIVIQAVANSTFREELWPMVEDQCYWWLRVNGTTPTELADSIGLRSGSIQQFVWNTTDSNGVNFVTIASFDETFSIRTAAFSSLLLQLVLLVGVLGGLSVLRRDAEIYVLGPLRRMLRIVARYAKNPLIQPKMKRSRSFRRSRTRDTMAGSDSSSSSTDDSASRGSGAAFRNPDHMLGSYETEQLITAVTKITDLLRKCWGVAGADIISTNLATREGALTEVFNPTVPGKSVYALFGFAAINGFDHCLRNLGGDVMSLINDVAAVLHGEVFRWGFGDSGQCNKNLGSAFLMVFRIGLVKEVIEKLEQATSVVFEKGTTAKSNTGMTRRRHHRVYSHQHSNSGTFSSSTSSTLGELPASLLRPPSMGLTRGVSNMSKGSSGVTSAVAAGAGGGSSGGTVISGGTSAAGGGNNGSNHASTTPASVITIGPGLGGSGGTMPSRRRVQRSASVKAMSLSLASLPGISTFTDRAIIGMLKSFAEIYRDNRISRWNDDFRLGAGVGAFTVSMLYGMDAGWAVEGAVGSEYKIDATYLSPHVNMASRMMGACKQYGVTIMLSQAVQELMSDVARSKLRHVDTVTVKGSSIKQRVYTYDCRRKGVDFFLYSRPDEQADVDADRYTPNIWNSDQDLKAMRQHLTEDFLQAFKEGHKAYLTGDWPYAIKRLERANEIMIETAVEEGYLEDEIEALQAQAGNDAAALAEELKRENGDGPSMYLIQYMKSQGGVAPRNWEGWHPLTRK